jgi:hypothetical protein
MLGEIIIMSTWTLEYVISDLERARLEAEKKLYKVKRKNWKNYHDGRVKAYVHALDLLGAYIRNKNYESALADNELTREIRRRALLEAADLCKEAGVQNGVKVISKMLTF